MSSNITRFETAYDAGFDAGKYGANNFNSHYSWFSTKEKMQHWLKGNNAGSAKREAERVVPKSKK